MDITDEPMAELLALLRGRLATLRPGETLRVTTLDPGTAAQRFCGEPVVLGAVTYRYRDHATWLDVCEILGCTYDTPRPMPGGLVELRLRVTSDDAWHASARPSGDPEKYGADTPYANLDRFEQPTFVDAVRRAVDFLGLPRRPRVLSLGVNNGRELAGLDAIMPGGIECVGVDHSRSAIMAATAAYPRFRFICDDVANLPQRRDVGRFDLVVAINTLQSGGVDLGATLHHIVTERLHPAAGVVIGLPNSRYRGKALTYGTQARHRAGRDATPLLKDAAFTRRYLQQHRFDVAIMGKYTWLVVGARRG